METRYDSKRGCGYRKKGLYLVCDGPGRPCGRLPIPLDICPVCGAGIKFARSWTWVDADALMLQHPCNSDDCSNCPLSKSIGRAGLLWIGEKFYPTPDDWSLEADNQGVSRRIKSVPHGFELGKTWVLVAHKKAIETGVDEKGNRTFMPGIFHTFKPSAIEYVTDGTETEEELEKFKKRDITPVKVVKLSEQNELKLEKE